MFGWTFGLEASTDFEAVRWTQVLVAGLAAVALFRSSLMLGVFGTEFAVGPGRVLQAILEASQTAVDRNRAQQRSKVLREVMGNVSFEKAAVVLPAYCVTLMQGLSASAEAELARGVEALKKQGEIHNSAKILLLGSLLLTTFGEDVLRSAVLALGDQIRGE